ncbi:HEAT repeat domain-containing protein [Streptomyces benahoarensis]|uniref:MerR family transcriptional regulator n=1 Tax=Streptomyces benahoarensis TaxID=2595054 RepID=A0A553Z8P4_9ACTN|nr:HEAT repeat domain-containing protein [Streptomyces benahoarensis]TSB25279.1 MerR family transcriptional regulator [Streptomyces benahoarensis]TSB37811.1 MerR family transcriptional regulator [Streptomyces benahoarensis]
MLIGEVARRSGVSARMLRHYDTLGLVRPTGRSGSGYREYSGDDLRRLFQVESLRSLGLSLREVGRALDGPGFAPAELVDDLIRQTRERLATETALLTRLRRIGAAEPADWADVLQTVALLQALGSESAGRRQRAALSAAAEGPTPVEALVEAVLSESDPNVAGALRWALARSGDAAPALLAKALDAPAAATRQRAVQALAALPGDATTAPLRDALAHPDTAVRRGAALALGARGLTDAIPTLVDMVAEEANDVDAADALSALAGDPAVAEQIATGLVARLAPGATGAPVRRRLAQALAGIPGDTAARALGELSRDEDRGVAVTAGYVLTLRDASFGGGG